ncbi:MAG: DUF2094 domain-containing protein [Planctomycetes bacterium]|nr:DUF2094 domain-containing protein [Planctomycetota bacterium]
MRWPWSRDEAPLLQAYGKLPLAKDYLRIGAAEGSGRELRDWLDTTFSGSALAGTLELPWPARFLLAPRSGAPLQGCLWPSHDDGGLRRFPFALFVERRRAVLRDALPSGGAGEAGFWEALEERFAGRDRFVDGRALLEAWRGQEVAAIGAPPSREPAADAWLAALWPGEGVAGLRRQLADLATSDDGRAPLRLPLTAAAPFLPQARAWGELLARRGRLAAPERTSIVLPLELAPGAAPPSTPALLLLRDFPSSHATAAWLAPPAARPAAPPPPPAPAPAPQSSSRKRKGGLPPPPPPPPPADPRLFPTAEAPLATALEARLVAVAPGAASAGQG